MRYGVGFLLALAFSGVFADQPGQRTLTFEDRVKTQEAIERVYYSHQIGATRPFDESLTRDVLERKVQTNLKQTVALERRWNTPVTKDMLQRETDRMAEHTRLPDRFPAVGSSI